MTDGQTGGPSRDATPAAARWLVAWDGTGYRLALLVLLTLLAVLGLHASVPQPAWDSHTKAHDAAVVGALEGVAVVLFLLVAWRGRRPSSGQVLVTKLRTALKYLLGAGALALAVALVALLVNIGQPKASAGRATRPAPVAPTGRLRLPKSVAPSTSNFPVTEVLYGLLAALLLAAIVVVAVKAFRSRAWEAGPELEPPAEEYGSALQEAILGGQRALLELDDARAAIIACYVAMEESLARAGTARSVAETPDELLAKAARQLLISPGAASRLTSLFYEARFSTHPLDDSQKEAAQRALAELAAELDRGRPVGAGTVEAGTVGAGTVEAGTVEAGTAEAGTVEAGTVEAGTVEAGAGP